MNVQSISSVVENRFNDVQVISARQGRIYRHRVWTIVIKVKGIKVTYEFNENTWEVKLEDKVDENVLEIVLSVGDAIQRMLGIQSLKGVKNER